MLSYYADSAFCILPQLHVYDKRTDMGTNYSIPMSVILFICSFSLSALLSSFLYSCPFPAPAAGDFPPLSAA